MDRRNFMITALAALGSGCFPAAHLVEAQYLRVTDGTLHPFTYTTMSRGEHRLSEIAAAHRTNKEDSWLFLRREGSELGRWVDTGFNQTLGSVEHHKPLIYDELKNADDDCPSDEHILCTRYHIHPLKAMIQSAHDIRHFLEFAGLGSDKIYSRHLEIVSIPSSNDFLEHSILDRFIKKNFENITFTKSKVVAPTGVFSYSTTEQFLQLHESEGDDGIEKVILTALLNGYRSNNVDSSLRHMHESGMVAEYTHTRNLSPIEF